MPTYVGKEINGFWETMFIGYSHKELTTHKILKETETYKNKIKEWEDYAKKENWSLEQFYNYLGYDEPFEEHKKSLMIDGMIKENKLKSYHDKKKNKIMYRLV